MQSALKTGTKSHCKRPGKTLCHSITLKSGLGILKPNSAQRSVRVIYLENQHRFPLHEIIVAVSLRTAENFTEEIEE